MPHMEDFDPPLVLSHAIEDPDGRMHKTPNVWMVSDGRTHPRKTFEEIDVIKKSADEPFRCVRVKFPRPAFDLFKVG